MIFSALTVTKIAHSVGSFLKKYWKEIVLGLAFLACIIWILILQSKINGQFETIKEHEKKIKVQEKEIESLELVQDVYQKLSDISTQIKEKEFKNENHYHKTIKEYNNTVEKYYQNDNPTEDEKEAYFNKLNKAWEAVK